MTRQLSDHEMERIYELLDQAKQETDIDKIKALANEVLTLDEDNLDAKALIISVYDLLRQKVELEELIAQEGDRLEKDESIPLEIGEFYTIFETRPYIRLRVDYCAVLRNLEMNRLAMQEAEEILRLNENDNMGMRYLLYLLYAKLEEKDRAEKLFKNYEEDNFAVNLPLSLLYFKVGELNTAKKYLKLADQNNDYFHRYLNDTIDLDEALSKFNIDQDFSSGTMDEFIDFLVSSREILSENPSYIYWAKEELNQGLTL